MVKVTIDRDLTRHDNEVMVLSKKLMAGRDTGKDTKEIMFATCYTGSL